MKSYHHNKRSKCIMYLDAHNLYGCAMSQYLHYSEFKWLNKNKFDKFIVTSIEKNSSIGYILEVDLEYLDELHDLHNDYSLVPEKI